MQLRIHHNIWKPSGRSGMTYLKMVTHRHLYIYNIINIHVHLYICTCTSDTDTYTYACAFTFQYTYRHIHTHTHTYDTYVVYTYVCVQILKSRLLLHRWSLVVLAVKQVWSLVFGAEHGRFESLQLWPFTRSQLQPHFLEL